MSSEVGGAVNESWNLRMRGDRVRSSSKQTLGTERLSQQSSNPGIPERNATGSVPLVISLDVPAVV